MLSPNGLLLGSFFSSNFFPCSFLVDVKSYSAMDSVSPDDGRVLTVQSENFRLSELLSERDFEETRERIVVYEGQKLDDGATVILKLRYQYASCFPLLFLLANANLYRLVEGALC